MPQVTVEGYLGLDTTAADVRRQLGDGGGDVELRVNSPGGDLHEGVAIYNALIEQRRQGRQVNATITGMAASAAGYVTLAANRTRVEANSLLMIHNVWAIVAGDYREMAKQAEFLQAASRVIADAYASRSGRPLNEIRTLMDAETWYYGQEILDAGFADELLDAPPARSERRDSALASARLAVAAMQDQLRTRPAALEQLAACLLPLTDVGELSLPMSGVAEMSLPPTLAAALKIPPDADERAVMAAFDGVLMAAVTAERERILGILECPQAADRHPAAVALAKTAGLLPANAAAVLGALPAAEPPRRMSEFEKHMAALGNPPITPDDERTDRPFDPRAWSIIPPR